MQERKAAVGFARITNPEQRAKDELSWNSTNNMKRKDEELDMTIGAGMKMENDNKKRKK